MATRRAHAEIDEEHAEQLGLVDEIERLAAGGGPPAELDELLGQLLEVTTQHFTSEQLLMLQHGYPGFEAHLREHESLLEGAHALRASCRWGDPARIRGDLAMLRRWVTAHITRADQELVRFLLGDPDDDATPAS